MKTAFGTHQPRPYDGPVFMISSRGRIQRIDPIRLKRLFTGKVERLEVATTHSQLLDVRNEVFASHLKHCLG